MKKIVSFALLFLQSTYFFAQNESQNNDFMRSTGKINVVVAVIFATFVGIILFLVRIDKKLTKLENQIK